MKYFATFISGLDKVILEIIASQGYSVNITKTGKNYILFQGNRLNINKINQL